MATTNDSTEARSIEVGLTNGEVIWINGDDWVVETIHCATLEDSVSVLRGMDGPDVLCGATIPWSKVNYVILHDTRWESAT